MPEDNDELELKVNLELIHENLSKNCISIFYLILDLFLKLLNILRKNYIYL